MEPISEVIQKVLNLVIPDVAPLLKSFVFLKLFKSSSCIYLHLPPFNSTDTKTDSHSLHSHHISTNDLLSFPVSIFSGLLFKLNPISSVLSLVSVV